MAGAGADNRQMVCSGCQRDTAACTCMSGLLAGLYDEPQATATVSPAAAVSRPAGVAQPVGAPAVPSRSSSTSTLEATPVAPARPAWEPMEPARPAVAREGWYPDPDNASQRRWWDGVRWTDARSPVSHPAPNQSAAATAPRPSGNGLAGVIPRVRIRRRGVFDAFVFQDCLVFAKVPGVNLETVFGIVGALFAGALGAILGLLGARQIQANGNTGRLTPLLGCPPDDLARRHPKSRLYARHAIGTVEGKVTGAGGQARVPVVGAGVLKLRWYREYEGGTDPGGLLSQAASGRAHIRYKRGRFNWGRVALLAAAVLLTGAMVVRVLDVVVTVSDAVKHELDRSPAERAALESCQIMAEHVEDKPTPTPEELRIAAAASKPAMAQAASTDPTFVHAATSLAWLEANVSEENLADPAQRDELMRHANIVDSACAAL